MIRGILFDVDGVLIDSEKTLNKAAVELFSEFGANAKEEDFIRFVGRGELAFVKEASLFYGFALDDPEGAVDRLYSIYERIAAETGLGPMTGAVEFVKRCKNAGLKIALGSSARIRKVIVNLKLIGLEPSFFDSIVDASAVERTKPSPDIFSSCVYRLGLKPDECVVIEDAVNGLRSAKYALCSAIGITGWFNPEELLLAGADAVYDNLSCFPYFDSVESFNSAFEKEMLDFYSKTAAGRLIDTASEVLENAYSKYSHYRVGAAILTESGRIFRGCNVENASFGGTICAERNAATTAVAEEGPGVRFKAIAIASESDEPAPPCGICRQFLTEFMGPDAQVWLYSTKSHVIRHYNFAGVMPYVFEL